MLSCVRTNCRIFCGNKAVKFMLLISSSIAHPIYLSNDPCITQRWGAAIISFRMRPAKDQETLLEEHWMETPAASVFALWLAGSSQFKTEMKGNLFPLSTSSLLVLRLSEPQKCDAKPLRNMLTTTSITDSQIHPQWHYALDNQERERIDEALSTVFKRAQHKPLKFKSYESVWFSSATATASIINRPSCWENGITENPFVSKQWISSLVEPLDEDVQRIRNVKKECRMEPSISANDGQVCRNENAVWCESCPVSRGIDVLVSWTREKL